MAFPYVKEAFGLKSGNSDAQTNLIANLSNFLIIDESGIETLSKIDSIAIEYPEILENNNFVRVYGLCQLKSIESHFKNKNPELGNDTIADFEKLNSVHETIRFDENFIGRAYSEAAVYYFKKGQNKKCREYLNRGRELAPNSNELKSRLIMLQ